MKLLLITNIILQYPSKKLGIKETVFGGWIYSFVKKLKKVNDIKIAIATVYNGKNIKEYNDNGIKYYLIPGKLNCKYDKKQEKYWKKINEEFKPDIVHLQGSEFSHGLAFLKACPNVKSVVSIQGLVSKIGENYLSLINNFDIIKNITFRDIIRFDNIFQSKNSFLKRGENEKKIILNANYVIGRTYWDYSNALAINPRIKYFVSNEILRDSFYNVDWNIDNAEKNSIYVSQASYPIKGLHMLIKAINIVKNTFPDVKVYVAGNNIIDTSTVYKKIKLSGYGKYLLSLITKYNLEKNIIFIGIADEKQVLNKMLKCNLFVLPSQLENSSNSLCEAMLIGMPCIAAYTGGTPSMIKHEKEGLLYSYNDYEVLANYINDIFSNKQLAIKLSKKSQIRAKERHNKDNILNELLTVYNKIYLSEI